MSSLSSLELQNSLSDPHRQFTSDLWRSALLTAITIVALLVLYWKTATTIAEMWRAPSYSHCYLILPTSLYLVWLRRERLVCLVPRPSAWGFLFLAGLSFAWLLGALTEVLVLQNLALVGMAISLVWALLGTEMLLDLRFALAFLFFAVPVGDSLVPHLQDFTAWFAVKALDLIGVPVLLEGRVLTVRSGTWEVATGCSGIRFVITSLAIGFLYAGLALQSWKRRILFMIVAALIPILANGLRVFGIVILGEYSGDAASAYFHHVTYGWLFFSLVTVSLLLLGSRLREPSPKFTSAPLKDSSLGLEGLASESRAYRLTKATLTAIAAVSLLASAPIALFALNKNNTQSAPFALDSLKVTSPWATADLSTLEWKPEFVGTSSVSQQVYFSGSRKVVLHFAYYSPRGGTKLASSQNLLYREPPWQRISEDVVSAVVGGRQVWVNETVVRSSRTSFLIWNWYWVGGEFTQSAYRAKYLLARSRLLADKRGAAAIAIGSDFTTDRSTADFALRDFLSHSAFLSDSALLQ